ncbi:hypothetical protein [Psychrobacillus sp. FJAT-21963]|uniref:hypothetical protein n=1 Tax=Psychrobacillus sp. FJAT-21963 TaxID=1712028 RepID=UPI000707DF56|nr:hypothetical protein [Psychrobacillus sp. FJAT-21963]KQL34367.1 hypothetical protein AN959_15310 [Psychrobacillus sp. FJAT-21963]
MLFLIILLYCIIVVFLIIKNSIKISTALLPLLFFSILSNVTLSQNYTQSLLSEANDGIGVSNFLSSFILPDDYWSQELFHSSYELTTNLSLLLLIVYILTIVVESIFLLKRKTNLASDSKSN